MHRLLHRHVHTSLCDHHQALRTRLFLLVGVTLLQTHGGCFHTSACVRCVTCILPGLCLLQVPPHRDAAPLCRHPNRYSTGAAGAFEPTLERVDADNKYYQVHLPQRNCSRQCCLARPLCSLSTYCAVLSGRQALSSPLQHRIGSSHNTCSLASRTAYGATGRCRQAACAWASGRRRRRPPRRQLAWRRQRHLCRPRSWRSWSTLCTAAGAALAAAGT